jgi:hypothetical protein
MKYLFLLQSGADGPPAAGSPEAARLFAEYQVAL